jgi:thymidine kinase
MGDQLKQALMNAGLLTKKDLEREKVKKKHISRSAKIREDHIRIVCDVCGKTAPDVERYSHKNRLIEGKEWLCLMCADEYSIDDNFRMTHQSSNAKTGLFSRRYGRTKKF